MNPSSFVFVWNISDLICGAMFLILLLIIAGCYALAYFSLAVDRWKARRNQKNSSQHES